jgi:hypothetical protein
MFSYVSHVPAVVQKQLEQRGQSSTVQHSPQSGRSLSISVSEQNKHKSYRMKVYCCMPRRQHNTCESVQRQY